jgi:hypothetical protein
MRLVKLWVEDTTTTPPGVIIEGVVCTLLTGTETAKLCVKGKMSYLNLSGVSGSISHETE